MDKSLDEIISTRPKGGRRGSGRRGAGRQAILGNNTAPTPRAKAVAAKPAAQSQPASDKIVVSNLPPDVNEQQIKELFHTTVGPLREVTLHYDSSGRSKGVAAVQFSRRGDATKAYEQYNNRLIDSKRPMKIEIVVDPSRIPAVPLASRVAPAAGASTRGTAGRGRRGAGAGRGGARPPRKEKVPKTAADLDAEMEDYTASNVVAAA
ncbi:hypothetical protein C8J56DRAFT_915103 [Mycena floridula]|nr:hypothetical protein C8J56DRAFT_915103 [Mycena floridula]